MKCGAPQPGRMTFCEREDEHTEHRATLSYGSTYCYWFVDGGPVRYASGHYTDPDVVRTVMRASRPDPALWTYPVGAVNSEYDRLRWDVINAMRLAEHDRARDRIIVVVVADQCASTADHVGWVASVRARYGDDAR